MTQNGGAFITLEGIDGCGKSTQAEYLREWLAVFCGLPAIRTFEPGGWSGGALLRRLLLDEKNAIAPDTELLLFLADRSAHLDSVISPALSEGKWVVCERYTDSTLAYQSFGRGIGLDRIESFLNVCKFREPDLTIFLDIEVSLAEARLRERGKLDRIESSEGGGFMSKVAHGYRELAKRHVERIVTVDARGDALSVGVRVREAVTRRFGVAETRQS
ncbi:thymidylate kinase [Synergistales bacterium]|nr:thymidylate kinase [Synergistales bacterium]